jgi:hypothetical protein
MLCHRIGAAGLILSVKVIKVLTKKGDFLNAFLSFLVWLNNKNKGEDNNPFPILIHTQMIPHGIDACAAAR